MRLYELTGLFSEAMDKAESSEPADQDAWLETLIGIEDEIGSKLENCACIVKSLELESEAVAKEEERLYARKKALENNAKRLKVYMGDAMRASGIQKSKGEKFTVSLQKNPASVAVDDISPKELPPRFQRVKVEIDTAAIGEALKAGEVLAFAQLKQSESIRIR